MGYPFALANAMLFENKERENQAQSCGFSIGHIPGFIASASLKLLQRLDFLTDDFALSGALLPEARMSASGICRMA